MQVDLSLYCLFLTYLVVPIQGSGLLGYTVDLYKTDEEVRGKYIQKVSSKFINEYPNFHLLAW